MNRAYDQWVARLFDRVPPATVLLMLLVLTGLIAALWYWFPAWVPRRWPRLRMPRFRVPRFRLRWPKLRWPKLRWPKLRWPKWRRRRRKPKAAKPSPAPQPAPVVAEPAVTAAPRPGMSLADRHAAEGRYAEAIRERLRDTVADLTSAGVITPQPGTTAAELTTAAANQRPTIGSPLGGATEIFSEIWYGQREASPGHDERMRALTAEVRAAVAPPTGRPR
jgi:Domain of unknown function (DUF4129)